MTALNLTRDLVDEEGENQAVRTFLMQYGVSSLTVGAMRKHMDRSGWPLQCCPEFARLGECDNEHLTKAGAQLWIRHLFSLERAALAQSPVGAEGLTDAAMLDWLERMGNEPEGLLLHDGGDFTGRTGLGLRRIGRSLRQAIAQAYSPADAKDKP